MFIALMFAAVIAGAPAGLTPECAARLAEAKPAIDHANNDWLRAISAGDAVAIAAAYADDSLFVLPDGQVLRGRQAVEAFYAARRQPSTPAGGGVTSLGVACGDDGVLYEWGEGEVRTRGADGAEDRRAGSYLTVWRKVGGAWKIVRNLAF